MLCVCVQLLVLLCAVLFVICLPVRLVLGLCCGVKLQPPQRERPGDGSEPDQDGDPIVINIPPDVVVDRPGTSAAPQVTNLDSLEPPETPKPVTHM